MIGRDDEATVELDTGQRLDSGAGRNDEILCLELLPTDLDRVAVSQPALALDDLDLVLLHQELDALVELVHDAVTSGRDALKVERHLLRVDAELLAPRCHPVVQLRGLQQRFGRDAPDVQAGAAELGRLDERHLQAELRSPDRSGITILLIAC